MHPAVAVVAAVPVLHSPSGHIPGFAEVKAWPRLGHLVVELLSARQIAALDNQALHSPNIPNNRLVGGQAAGRGEVVDMHNFSDGCGPQRTPAWAAI